MGNDVQLDYEIKYDKNLDHTIKYFRIRHGTYLEEDKLFDYFGRKHFDESRKRKDQEEISKTASVMSYDDLWIDTQAKLIQIFEMNEEMIKEDGRISRKRYVKEKIYGVEGITVKEILRIYPLIFGVRIPFAFLGFISPSQAIKKILSRLVRRRTDFKLVYC